MVRPIVAPFYQPVGGRRAQGYEPFIGIGTLPTTQKQT
jgi:hypothetical protein